MYSDNSEFMNQFWTSQSKNHEDIWITIDIHMMKWNNLTFNIYLIIVYIKFFAIHWTQVQGYETCVLNLVKSINIQVTFKWFLERAKACTLS